MKQNVYACAEKHSVFVSINSADSSSYQNKCPLSQSILSVLCSRQRQAEIFVRVWCCNPHGLVLRSSDCFRYVDGCYESCAVRYGLHLRLAMLWTCKASIRLEMKDYWLTWTNWQNTMQKARTLSRTLGCDCFAFPCSTWEISAAGANIRFSSKFCGGSLVPDVSDISSKCILDIEKRNKSGKPPWLGCSKE